MDSTQKFLENHFMRIIDTNKRAYRTNKFNTQLFTDPMDYNSFIDHRTIETEPLYTVEVPLSELNRMSEFENQVFNNMKTHGAGHYHMFNTLMEQKDKERYYRDKHPAVKKAYEHYSLMLKLAESGEL